MIKIEIESNEVRTKSGVSQKTGKPYEIRSQQGYAFIPGDKYPSSIPVRLASNQSPYEAGSYQLSPESLYIGRYGLELGKLKLIPLSK